MELPLWFTYGCVLTLNDPLPYRASWFLPTLGVYISTPELVLALSNMLLDITSPVYIFNTCSVCCCICSTQQRNWRYFLPTLHLVGGATVTVCCAILEFTENSRWLCMVSDVFWFVCVGLSRWLIELAMTIEYARCCNNLVNPLFS